MRKAAHDTQIPPASHPRAGANPGAPANINFLQTYPDVIRLGVGARATEKLEKRADLLLSTLKGYVEAAGGSLEIVARFPDGPALRIDRLGQVGRPKKADAA